MISRARLWFGYAYSAATSGQSNCALHDTDQRFRAETVLCGGVLRETGL